MSTGSLGQGVSAAAGMALAAKMKNPDVNVYTLLGDGEIEEGECWEAFMFANHYKLDNLCIKYHDIVMACIGQFQQRSTVAVARGNALVISH